MFAHATGSVVVAARRRSSLASTIIRLTAGRLTPNRSAILTAETPCSCNRSAFSARTKYSSDFKPHPPYLPADRLIAPRSNSARSANCLSMRA